VTGVCSAALSRSKASSAAGDSRPFCVVGRGAGPAAKADGVAEFVDDQVKLGADVVGTLEVVIVLCFLEFLPGVGDSFAIRRLGLGVEQVAVGLWLSGAVAGGCGELEDVDSIKLRRECARRALCPRLYHMRYPP
jgi:hypothetical protein